MSLAQEHKHTRLRATSSVVKKAKKKSPTKKPKSSPQRHQMRSSLQNINTNKTGACLGWAESGASPSCLLFIWAFAAIVTFHLLQLIPYSITLCPFSNTYAIHSTGAVRCCPPDVLGVSPPTGKFRFGNIHVHLEMLLFFFFFPPPQNWSPSMSLLCRGGSRYVGLPPLSLTSGLHTTNRCSAANVRLDFTS